MDIGGVQDEGKKIKRIILITVASFLVMLSVYVGWSIHDLRNIQLLVTISHGSLIGDTYFFRVWHDGTIDVRYGTRNHEYFERFAFMRIGSRRGRRQLTDEEHANLLALANELDRSEICTRRSFVWGCYLLEIRYRGFIYSLAYAESIEREGFEEIRQLVDELIALSPLSIRMRHLLSNQHE